MCGMYEKYYYVYSMCVPLLTWLYIGREKCVVVYNIEFIGNCIVSTAQEPDS